MGSKTKNTLIIALILVLIVLGGGLYSFIYQRGQIKDKEQKIKDLKLYELDTEALTQQLISLRKRVAELDSILALRKYNIPSNLSQSNFFDFINSISYSFSPYSYVNIEYDNSELTPHFNIFNYNLSGIAEFNDLNALIYGIEESKQLKKIASTDLSSNVKVDDDGTPHYLVNYKFKVSVYSSNEDRFTVKNSRENSLIPNPAYDFFYPLIRNEIPPNTEKLLDVQTAHLLALIPDGAFLADASGNTYLLWEGDHVYLGYLTEINYQTNQVNFILNKGGVIENVNLKLERENKPSK